MFFSLECAVRGAFGRVRSLFGSQIDAHIEVPLE